ncbi:MAG: hypothetical protein IPP40_02670 [bacterium]|nr:hypothetical protein [bacterium]
MKSVYLIGIGGIAMANVAVLLRSAGYEVTGSDQGVYEPAASLLKRAGIIAKTPYGVDNLPQDRNTTVIVGNVQSRGQIEVEEALRRNLQLESFPGFLRRTVMAHKTRVVIAGTHGKSTTTACVAHLLNELGRDPSYLIGADPLTLPYGGNIGSGAEFVIEGDEYDSAFFDKRSKFLDYFPNVLLLGRVEHDHLDIFPTLEEMLVSFRRLVAQLPSNGKLIVAADSPLAMELAQKAPCDVITVSADSVSDYSIHEGSLKGPNGSKFDNFAPGVIGDYNQLNVAMSIAAVETLGISLDDIVNAAKTFKGIKRRLELLFESANTLVFDDFAHHPTAITAAIKAIRKRFPQHHVIAVFEPRSNTAVRNKYQDEFRAALANAHEVIIGTVHRKDKVPASEVVDTDRMVSELKAAGVPAISLENKEIPNHLANGHSDKSTIVLFMSNGGFSSAPAEYVSLLMQASPITA